MITERRPARPPRSGAIAIAADPGGSFSRALVGGDEGGQREEEKEEGRGIYLTAIKSIDIYLALLRRRRVPAAGRRCARQLPTRVRNYFKSAQPVRALRRPPRDMFPRQEAKSFLASSRKERSLAISAGQQAARDERGRFAFARIRWERSLKHRIRCGT